MYTAIDAKARCTNEATCKIVTCSKSCNQAGGCCTLRSSFYPTTHPSYYSYIPNENCNPAIDVVESNAGAVFCPAGTDIIRSEDCLAAAQSLHPDQRFSFHRTRHSSYYPYGCQHKGNQVIYNSYNSNGRYTYGYGGRLLCGKIHADCNWVSAGAVRDFTKYGVDWQHKFGGSGCGEAPTAFPHLPTTMAEMVGYKMTNKVWRGCSDKNQTNASLAGPFAHYSSDPVRCVRTERSQQTRQGHRSVAGHLRISCNHHLTNMQGEESCLCERGRARESAAAAAWRCMCVCRGGVC